VIKVFYLVIQRRSRHIEYITLGRGL